MRKANKLIGQASRPDYLYYRVEGSLSMASNIKESKQSKSKSGLFDLMAKVEGRLLIALEGDDLLKNKGKQID
jgi:hypothetical protein